MEQPKMTQLTERGQAIYDRIRSRAMEQKDKEKKQAGLTLAEAFRKAALESQIEPPTMPG